MNILHLSSEYPPQSVYGLGRYVSELAEAQVSVGHSVEVITNSLGGNEHDVRRNGVRVRRVCFPPPPKAPSVSSMLLHFNLQLVERFVEEHYGRTPEFDVINAHDWLTFPAAFHLARLAKRPLVTTIHDVVFNKVRGRSFADEDAYVAGVENWACHASTRVIALSETVREELIGVYSARPERILVIPGGVAIEPLSRKSVIDLVRWRDQRAKWDEELMLYVGRLEPEKGLSTLLEAARLLYERARSWRLVIAGTGRLVDSLIELIKKNCLTECVHLIGYLPFHELRMAYAAADVTIVPSDYEPFGLVALESQRMGTPVISAETGGLAETIPRTRGGLTFLPGDASKLAECMERLLADSALRAQLGRNGQQNVARLFNWGKIASHLSDLYARIRHDHPPASLELPSWKFPSDKSPTVAPAGDPLNREPLSDLTVIWNADDLAGLQPVLNALARSQALIALGGLIHVVRAMLGSKGSAPAPSVPASVRFVDLKAPDDLLLVLVRSAGVVIDARAAVQLQQSGLVDTEKIPVIWFGSREEKSIGKWHVEDPTELYALAGKLLCDERLRMKLAPRVEHKIPQIRSLQHSPSVVEVLHILPQLVTGGAETMLLELVKATRDRFQSEIVSLGPLEGPLPDEFRRLGTKVHDLSKSIASEILALIESKNPRLLHLHSMSYVKNWIPVHRRLAEWAILETEHVVNIGSGHFGPVDHVVCVSEATLAAHNPFRKISDDSCVAFSVVYNGINLSDYHFLPSKKEARQRLGLPLDRPILGRVSALARNKMPKESLELIPVILRTIPKALFVIVGDGPQRSEVAKWVHEHGLTESIVLLGERRDIPQVLRAFDVFAYYTTKDALGNVILEAIAAGVPVVATDIEGTREALDPQNGKLIPLGEFEAFSEAIKAILADPQKWQQTLKLPKRFAAAEMARQYSALYRNLWKERHCATAVSLDQQAIDLLIKLPTRGRPEQFFNTLERYFGHLSGRHKVKFVITCDIDDSTMNNDDTRLRLSKLPDLEVEYRPNKSKVEAINAGLSTAGAYSVLMAASDDMLPEEHGYDSIIMAEMKQHFPDGDGVLFFNDGYRGNALNTLPILGKKYFDRFGYIYHPSYISLWCDNEFTEVSRLLQKQHYDSRVIIRHAHPLNTGGEIDELYKRNDYSIERDHRNYDSRKLANFGL